MERNVKDLVYRQNLIFAKSPFEKMTYVKSNNPKIETRLVIEAPTKVLLNQPKSEHNFQKSNLSKLRIESPLERKEFLKISEEIIEKPQSPIIKNYFQKFVETPKEDWEKRDFIRLENWHLLLNSNSGDISIIGYRSDIEELWLSDTVLFRIDEKRIMTKSKTCYQLIGMIDSSNQKSNIISSEFETGFPEDWKEILIKKR